MVMRDLHESTETESAEATELISQQEKSDTHPAGPANPIQPQVSVTALLALVLSVFGLLLVPGIIGLILAVVALWQINRSDGQLIGREIAVTALILSTVLLVYHLILWGFVTAAAAAAGFMIDSIDGFFGWIASWFE